MAVQTLNPVPTSQREAETWLPGHGASQQHGQGTSPGLLGSRTPAFISFPTFYSEVFPIYRTGAKAKGGAVTSPTCCCLVLTGATHLHRAAYPGAA